MSIAICDGREFGRRVKLVDRHGQPRGEEYIVAYAELTDSTLGYWVENEDGHKLYYEAGDLVFLKPFAQEVKEMKAELANQSFSLPTGIGSDAEN